MAYYFVHFDSSEFKGFVEGHEFLRAGFWIKAEDGLPDHIPLRGDNVLFVIDFQGPREDVDGFALLVREERPEAKLIYVVRELNAQDLKAHQLTPAGGDVYIPRNITSDGFLQILSGITEGTALRDPLKEEFKLDQISVLKSNPLSMELDRIFKSVTSLAPRAKLVSLASLNEGPVEEAEIETELSLEESDIGEPMSDKDQELSLEDLGDLELGGEAIETPSEDSGLDLSLDGGDDLSLGDSDEPQSSSEDDFGLSLEDGDDVEAPELKLSGEDEVPMENLGELDLGSMDDFSLVSPPQEAATEAKVEAPVTDDFGDLSLGDSELSFETGSDDLSLGEPESLEASSDLSDEAMEKLKEIDAIMTEDSKILVGLGLNLSNSDESSGDQDIDEPLVSDDLNLDNLNFAQDDIEAMVEETVAAVEKPKKKPKALKAEAAPAEEARAYTGDLERTQVTIANLRADRDELLAKIQKLEEEKLLQNRQSLTMRAELDEKKIEISIMRRKLSDEISDLKERMSVQDEKRLILEEKNKLLQQELDKAGQKSRLDVKRVQMRESELEQKLELLKADAETQIRNRDLKILELKRKIDAMEFDMESITTQEKRSVESRFELEDKLDKAIKTLRSAITVLEDESDNRGALEALKKNIDM